MDIPDITKGQCPNCFIVHPGFDHIHEMGDKRPEPGQKDGRVVIKGFVTHIFGAYGSVCTFFSHLEPALAFGRAARMSKETEGFGVHDAYLETELDPRLQREVRSLTSDRDPIHVSRDDEHEILLRWVDGCQPDSHHYVPPDGC